MNRQIYWSPGVTLEQIEEQVIQKALVHFRGNKSQAAIALGISARTIDNKLEKYELAAAEGKTRNDDRKRDRAIQLARARGVHQNNSYPLFSEKDQQGVRLESIANAPTQPQVPVPQRPEVQEVLPPEFAASRARRRG